MRLNITSAAGGGPVELSANPDRLKPVAVQAMLAGMGGPLVARDAPGITSLESRQKELKTQEKTPVVTVERKLVAGDLDYLEFCCYGEWGRAEGRQFMKAVEAAKRQSALAKKGQPPGMVQTDVGSFIVGPKRAGFWQYLLKYAETGISIKLAGHTGQHDSIASLQVSIPSITFMRYGRVEALRLAWSALAALGFKSARNVVSRADLCSDFVGIPVSEFYRAWSKGQCVTYAGGDTAPIFANNDPNIVAGFVVGKGARNSVQFYNKLSQLFADGEAEKHELLKANRWGCDATVATRVEFRMAGDALKSRGITTVESLMESLGTLTTWLTGVWFRLTEDVPDRANGNHARVGPSALWQKVQQAFTEWTGDSTAPLAVPPVKVPSVRRLMKMIGGCITSVYSRTAEDFGDLCEFSQVMIRGILAEVNNQKSLDEALRKHILWQSAGHCPGYSLGEVPY